MEKLVETFSYQFFESSDHPPQGTQSKVKLSASYEADEEIGYGEEVKIEKPKKRGRKKKQRFSEEPREKEREKANKHWSEYEKKKYWLGVKRLMKQCAYIKLTWKNYKTNQFFVKIVSFFNGTRTRGQIKSFDQRMKEQYFEKREIDIEDAIQLALFQLELTKEEQIQIENEINEFHKVKIESDIKKEFEDINKKLDDAIQKNQETKMQLQDLKRNYFSDLILSSTL